jgi:hypothetical protein
MKETQNVTLIVILSNDNSVSDFICLLSESNENMLRIFAKMFHTSSKKMKAIQQSIDADSDLIDMIGDTSMFTVTLKLSTAQRFVSDCHVTVSKLMLEDVYDASRADEIVSEFTNSILAVITEVED